MLNREPPDNATVENCNTAIVETDLEVPALEEQLIFDGVVVHTQKFRQSKVRGRWDPNSQTYIRDNDGTLTNAYPIKDQ